MNYQVLEMQKFFQDNYKLHAVSELEDAFSPVGETDQEKRKSSMAFVKRMTVLQTPLEELFQKQCDLMTAFSDFKTTYKMGFNENSFYSLAALYGKLEKCLKEFSKTLKKHSNQPEIDKYFKEAEPYLATNVFNMMKEDFESFEVITKARMQKCKETYPNFNEWDSATPDWEIVKDKYKTK